MGRNPCCNIEGQRKGAWTPEEDTKLISCIQKHGEGNWRSLPQKAGLLRCGKSCRLRWTNYLRPDIKRGEFSQEEEMIIIQLHDVLGNKWSTIAKHLPRRTDNEIKNHWNTKLKRRILEIPAKTTHGNNRKPFSKSPEKMGHENDHESSKETSTTSSKNALFGNEMDETYGPVAKTAVMSISSADILNKMARNNKAVLSRSMSISGSTGVTSPTSSTSSFFDFDQIIANSRVFEKSGSKKSPHDPIEPRRPVSASAQVLNNMASKLAMVNRGMSHGLVSLDDHEPGNFGFGDSGWSGPGDDGDQGDWISFPDFSEEFFTYNEAFDFTV